MKGTTRRLTTIGGMIAMRVASAYLGVFAATCELVNWMRGMFAAEEAAPAAGA